MLVNKEYKDSGVSWLGNIPALWNIVKTKRHFQNEKRVAGKYANQYERLALTMNGVIKRDKEDAEGLQPESFEGYQVLEQNQLVFKLIDLENVKTSRVGLSPYTGIVSPAYIILHNDQQDNRFYYYYYMNMYYQEIFNYLGGEGVRSALNAKDLLETPIPDISLKQQKVIADYLDGECARIDGIVTTQRQIIERLKEYKKSVITETVTRGLNPDVPMKDSGIEWIGKIPEHWKAGKTFYCLEDIGSGTTPSGEDYYTEDGINWLNTGDLTDGYIREIPKKITPKAMEDFSTLKLHQENSIVIAMYGATIGKLGIITKKTTTNQACCVMTPNKDLSYKFLFYCLYAGKDYMMYLSFGSGQPNINQNILRHFIIPHIPIEEQQAIADYLDRECARIDTIIEKRERMIELMTEYKKSLMYECVTGKKEIVDVVE